MQLPKDFVDSLEKDFGKEATSIIQAISNTSSPISLRYNSRKSKIVSSENPVLWHSQGEYKSEKSSFTLDPTFHGGKYYVQEASSMFIYEVLAQLQIKEDSKVLDLCAAPGGKSTLICDYLNDDGLLIANEVIKNRASILKENIIKWGSGNCIVTNNEPNDFLIFENYFDVILVDAPCSGEGMFRKDHEAINEWSLQNVETCTLRQKNIISSIINCLKPHGIIIYSTCTFNQNENINNVNHFCNEHELSSVQLELKPEWEIMEVKKEGRFGYQFLPDRLKGEGFFISIMKNNGHEIKSKIFSKKTFLNPIVKTELAILEAWVNTNDVQLFKNVQGDIYAYNNVIAFNINLVMDKLRVIYSGVKCGNLTKNVFIPDHALALSDLVNANIPRIELSKQKALQYLNKSLLKIDSTEKGWCIITYENIQLGWIKNLENRINNYYPSEWKIRMNINVSMGHDPLDKI